MQIKRERLISYIPGNWEICANNFSRALILNINKLSLSTNGLVLATQENIRLIKDTASEVKQISLSTSNSTLRTGANIGMISAKALEIQADLQETKAIEKRKVLNRWLSAPDPSINHHRLQ